MTTWTDPDQDPGLCLNKLTLDDPDTITLEEYRRWRDQTLFDDTPHRLPPQTIEVRGELL